MDQLKPALEQIKKYHFWILSGIIAVVYLGTWYMATSQIKEKFDTRVSKINSDFSTGQSVAGVMHHPNSKSAEQMQLRNVSNAESVLEAWAERYNRQEELLVWPQELHQDFIAKVEPLQPIELKVDHPTPVGQELSKAMRARYMNYIKNELPKLADIIQAKWYPKAVGTSSSPYGGAGGDPYSGGGGTGLGDGAGGGLGPNPGGGGFDFGGGGSDNPYAPPTAAEEPESVVEWAQSNQSYLQNSRFDWSTTADRLPTTLDILYAQEDLWVLTSLMEIIKATNGNADARFNATIKELVSLDLGDDASGIRGVGQIRRPTAASGGNPYASGGTSSPSQSGDPSASTNPYATGSKAAPSNDPADNRYVDAEYLPVKGKQLRDAFKSSRPEDSFLVVAKRMPVRLRMKMDVLKLPRFITECGNAPLTLEVRQVRINPPSTSSGGGNPYGGSGQTGQTGKGAMGGGGGGGPGGGTGLSPGAPDMGDNGYSGGGSSSRRRESAESPYDATVEVYGIIYIYNPPNAEKLGLPITAGQPPAQPDAAAQPAAGQPAGAAGAAEQAGG